MKQSPTSIALEEKFLQYIKTHEFFWLRDLKKELTIVEPKPGKLDDNYHCFGWLVRKFKRDQLIQPCDSRGSEKQYHSLIFER